MDLYSIIIAVTHPAYVPERNPPMDANNTAPHTNLLGMAAAPSY